MNLFSLFSRTPVSSSNSSYRPRLTWGAQSLVSASTRTSLFLKRQLWIWPAFATVLLATLGYFVHRSVVSTMQDSLRSQLQTLLSVEVAMLQNWHRDEISSCSSLANNAAVRETVLELLVDPEELPSGTAPPDKAAIRRKLQRLVLPTLTAHGYQGYLVLDKSRTIIASDHEDLVGQQQLSEYEGFATKALKGTPTVSPPFTSVRILKDTDGQKRAVLPTMFVAVPLRDSTFEIVAALCLRIAPQQEFTPILQLGRIGESGETYAFDRDGLMVSNSRFDNQLILTGIIPDRDDSESILNVQLRDPEGDLTAGYRPTQRRSKQPFTKAVAQAIAGKPGVDIDGYRDYRGVTVLGAWTWLPDFDVGVVTEIDHVEAYGPLTILHWAHRSLLVLLAASSVAIFLFSLRVARLQREAQKSAIEARQLGQYTLEQKLGAGGMGVVYKGHHAMLRRPTAIKLLDVDKVNDASIQRFEREVQLTCQLNHPNTVAIYDYGRTPEGVFYYAMEFLDGINLQELVEKYGPQPEARVIHILQQVCGSLYEAHSMGLVHRDVKPANIMLNRRGGEPDVVKVLDFGLVKAVDDAQQNGLTVNNSLTGTPLYMAPEAIQSPNLVDSRSDVYAVGAVGYFLLTGHPVFEAGNLVQLCQQHVDAIPEPPSARLQKPVSADLERAILACLEKLKLRRPQTARDLAMLLKAVPTEAAWSMSEADAWWDRLTRGLPIPTSSEATPFDRTVVGEVSGPED